MREIEDQIFEDLDYSEDFPSASYEECSFVRCNLKGADFRDQEFKECEFIDCDIGNANFGNTAFKEVRFTNCKMIGLEFGVCNTFLLDLAFDHCQLDFSSFLELDLRKTPFSGSSLKEVDFSGANLSEVDFDECNLEGALFLSCDLEKADFGKAHSYNLDPNRNKLKKTRFSREGLAGLLTEHDIVVI